MDEDEQFRQSGRRANVADPDESDGVPGITNEAVDEGRLTVGSIMDRGVRSWGQGNPRESSISEVRSV